MYFLVCYDSFKRDKVSAGIPYFHSQNLDPSYKTGPCFSKHCQLNKAVSDSSVGGLLVGLKSRKLKFVC